MVKHPFATRTVIGSLLVAAAAGAVATGSAAGSVAETTGKQYQKGYVTLVKGKATATTKLTSAKDQLDNGATQLTMYHQQLKDAKQQLVQGKQQLDQNRGPLMAAPGQLAAGYKALATANGQLTDAKQQLDDAAPQLAAARTQLAEGQKTLTEKTAELNAGKAKLAASAKQVVAGRKLLAQGKAAARDLSTLSAQLPRLTGAMADPRQTIGPSLGAAAPLFSGLTTWAQYAERATALTQVSATRVPADLQPVYTGMLQQAVAQNMPALPAGTPDAQVEAVTQQVTAKVQPVIIASMHEAGAAVTQGLNQVTAQVLPVAAQLKAALPQLQGLAPGALADLTPVVNLPEGTLTARLAKAQALAQLLGSAKFKATLTGIQATLAQQLKAGQAQLAQYAAGQKQVAAGEKALAAGAKTLRAGQAEYAEKNGQYLSGAAQYQAGLQQYQQGQQEYQKNLVAYQTGLAEFTKGETQYQAGVKEYTSQKAKVDAGQKEWDKNNKLYIAGKKQATKLTTAGQKQLNQAEAVLTTLGTKITKPKSGLADTPALTTTATNWPWLGLVGLAIISLFAALLSVLGGQRTRSAWQRTVLIFTGVGVVTAGALTLALPAVVKRISGGALTAHMSPWLVVGVAVATAAFAALGGYIARVGVTKAATAPEAASES